MSADAHTSTVATQHDVRPRRRRLRDPLGWLGLLALGTLTLALLDPHTPGRYPLCPTQALFGVDCPGCGGLRATHDLAHGNITEAFGHNALLVIVAPAVVLVLVRSIWLAWQGRAPRRLSARAFRLVSIVVVVALVVFTVVRNLPFGAFLASS